MDAQADEIRILGEVEDLLRDSAGLHYALSELAEDSNLKSAAARANIVRVGLRARFRARQAELAVLPSILSNDTTTPERADALVSLAGADLAGAQHHIELSDASVIEKIRQRLQTPDLSEATVKLLRLVIDLLVDERALR